MGKLKKVLGAFVHAPERFDTLAERIAQTNHRINAAEEYEKSLKEEILSLKEEIREIAEVQPAWLTRMVHTLGKDDESLRLLNRVMSTQPVVWGDEARLHIAPTAAMDACLFNTNSGEITVGDYSFAGSRVSLLAGSHDMNLTGFLRRDAELREGCDITVGKGVWLCSGCTLLGPCTVGDNAVIAAGAVVTPGTEVPPNTVWGGVPAKQIGKLELDENGPDGENRVLQALARSDGFLMTDGWSEKTLFEDRPEVGYFLQGKEGVLLADRKAWRLVWGVKGAEVCRLTLKGSEGEVSLELAGSTGEADLALPVREGEAGEVVATVSPENAELFISLRKPETAAVEIPAGQAERSAAEAGEMEETPEDPAVNGIDVEAIMEEIREEIRRNGPYEVIPDFDKMPGPGKQGETDAYNLRNEIEVLTEGYEIPLQFPDPSRNPAKRVYKKIAGKAAHFATAPLSLKVTETNRSMKTALESAADVIARQQEQIDELTETVKQLEKKIGL